VPIDRRHAFGDGPVYGRPTGAGLLALVGDLACALGTRSQVARAWKAFDAAALVEDGCMLGPAACCVNKGPRDRVHLGAQTVCRGTLRREHFGDGRLTIGEAVYIGDDCIVSCCDSITIGSRTLLAHGVQVFDNDSHPTDRDLRARDWAAILEGSTRPSQAIHHAPISIGEDVWIGFGSMVLKGISIGRGAVIAARSVVAEDVDPDTVVAGVPARPVGRPSPRSGS
jgi:acetyltransferase-like isoleucine patch superfamily enzyme